LIARAVVSANPNHEEQDDKVEDHGVTCPDMSA
jgi:hypothetical protein